MPRGPKGEKRPGDVIGAAIMVAKIATGEMDDDVPNESRRRGGLSGGKGRAQKMESEQRVAVARKAADVRWKLKP